MARPRKNLIGSSSTGLVPVARTTPFQSPSASGLVFWAESLGEALGRGVARGINSGLSSGTPGTSLTGLTRGRGRPPKFTAGFVAAERQCSVSGCGREARSKGLCSAHYQAERRRQMAKS